MAIELTKEQLAEIRASFDQVLNYIYNVALVQNFISIQQIIDVYIYIYIYIYIYFSTDNLHSK